MKTIETHIFEQRFLNRLENLCRIKTRFDKGYKEKDTFVIKRKHNKFWLGKHYASIGGAHGYTVDCLYCQYGVNENGHIFVNYRFGKRLTYRILFTVSIVIGIILGISIIWNAVIYENLDWNGIAVATLFCVIGLGGTFIRSKKERKSLEEHLSRICKDKKLKQE